MPDKHILVIDMDGTAIGVEANLTPEIVNFATQANVHGQPFFAGFYVCTARSTSEFIVNIRQYTHASIYNNPETSNPLTVTLFGDCTDVDLHYFLSKFLHRATNCFELVTQLKLFEVSTGDDVYYTGCGEAYHQLILPHEKALIASIDEDTAMLELTAPVSHPRPVGKQEYKNTQLQQIARHAKLLFPNDTIRLTFIDDLYHNCVSALKAVDGMERVSIRVLHFNNITRDIRSIYDVMSEYDAEEKGIVRAAKLFDGSDPNTGAASSSASTAEEPPRVMFIQ